MGNPCDQPIVLLRADRRRSQTVRFLGELVTRESNVSRLKLGWVSFFTALVHVGSYMSRTMPGIKEDAQQIIYERKDPYPKKRKFY